MKRTIHLFALIFGLVLAGMPATAANKVFLLGGQSNMVGVGVTSELVGPLAKYSGPQTGVYFWIGGTTGWAPLQAGQSTPGRFGPEMAFGYAMHNAFPRDTIYLVKYAVSGSMLADNPANPAHESGTWAPNASRIPTQLYPAFKATVDAALANLTGKNPVIAGMLWMQGESDAYLTADAAAYKDNLTRLIKTVRTAFNAPNMMFVIAQITTAYGSPSDNALVQAAQAAIPGKIAHAAWFPTHDLQRLPNDGHYATQGQIDLGLRFAKPFKKPSR